MSRGGTRVYFGRLPRDTRERDLERFVRGFGRVREVSIKLGYGFVVSSQGGTTDLHLRHVMPCNRPSLVPILFLKIPSSFHVAKEFDDPRDADDCVYDLNGRELLGER